MLLLTQREVEELPDVDALIDALAAAMGDLSAGRASVPAAARAHAQAVTRVRSFEETHCWA